MKDLGFTLLLALVSLLPADVLFADCAEPDVELVFLELTSATIDGEPADTAQWKESERDYVIYRTSSSMAFEIYETDGDRVYNEYLDEEGPR